MWQRGFQLYGNIAQQIFKKAVHVEYMLSVVANVYVFICKVKLTSVLKSIVAYTKSFSIWLVYAVENRLVTLLQFWPKFDKCRYFDQKFQFPPKRIFLLLSCCFFQKLKLTDKRENRKEIHLKTGKIITRTVIIYHCFSLIKFLH